MKNKAIRTNSQRFKHLPVFKGILHFTGTDNCAIYYNENIVGIGSLLSSSGKQFRCLWNSPEQKKYAGIAHSRMGRFGVRGYKQGDCVYICALYSPPNRSMQSRRLYKIREAIAHDEDARENLNQAFTGHHRSHNIYIPVALKNIKVSLKKQKSQEDIDMFQKKRKHQKTEKDDVELENLKEKRITELESFYLVRKFLDSTSLRLALIELHFSVAEIESARQLIDTAAKYMSHRAYG